MERPLPRGVPSTLLLSVRTAATPSTSRIFSDLASSISHPCIACWWSFFNIQFAYKKYFIFFVWSPFWIPIALLCSMWWDEQNKISLAYILKIFCTSSNLYVNLNLILLKKLLQYTYISCHKYKINVPTKNIYKLS